MVKKSIKVLIALIAVLAIVVSFTACNAENYDRLKEMKEVYSVESESYQILEQMAIDFVENTEKNEIKNAVIIVHDHSSAIELVALFEDNHINEYRIDASAFGQEEFADAISSGSEEYLETLKNSEFGDSYPELLLIKK